MQYISLQCSRTCLIGPQDCKIPGIHGKIAERSNICTMSYQKTKCHESKHKISVGVYTCFNILQYGYQKRNDNNLYTCLVMLFKDKTIDKRACSEWTQSYAPYYTNAPFNYQFLYNTKYVTNSYIHSMEILTGFRYNPTSDLSFLFKTGTFNSDTDQHSDGMTATYVKFELLQHLQSIDA